MYSVPGLPTKLLDKEDVLRLLLCALGKVADPRARYRLHKNTVLVLLDSFDATADHAQGNRFEYYLACEACHYSSGHIEFND
jgi:hypothetical protein